MSTSYSTNLALALPATGELSGTWGTTVNSNITNMLDEALGYQAYSATGGADTLTIPNGTTGVARSIYIQLNGTGGGSVAVPTTKTKMYFVFNNTSSAITFKVTGQTGVSIPAAAKTALVSNGTDVIVAENYFSALTLGAALPATSGGTGQTSYAVGDIVYASTTTALSKLADIATGNALISGGVGVAPSYGKIGLTTHVSGTLPATNGGTGQTSYAVGDIVYASTTTALSPLADVATGNALISGGVGVAPSYGKIGLTTHVSGTLPVANGGTGVTSSTGTGNNVLSALPSFGTTIGVGGATASASGSGISFPATQSASTDANTLDDYEEGTWTPALTIGGLTTGITYTTRSASYVKIGRIVYISLNIQLSSKGSLTGDVIITALPFTTNSAANGYAYFGAADYSAMSGATAHIYAQALNNSTNIYLCNGSLASTAVNIAQDTDLLNTSAFTLAGTYITS